MSKAAASESKAFLTLPMLGQSFSSLAAAAIVSLILYALVMVIVCAEFSSQNLSLQSDYVTRIP